MRDTAFSGAWSAQVLQCNVVKEVTEFANGEDRDTEICEHWIGIACCWAVGAIRPVCEVEAGQEPVVRAVFENVARGHGGEGEAVQENGFELALDEMRCA